MREAQVQWLLNAHADTIGWTSKGKVFWFC